MKPPTVLGSTILAFTLLALGPAVAQQAPPPPPEPQGQVDQQPPPDQPPPDQPDAQAPPDQAPQADQQPPDEDQDQMDQAQPPEDQGQQPRGKKRTSCTMKFDLKGWSAVYKSASGTGRISCDNGQKADVKLSAKGGGLTAGKYVIKGGRGKFSAVRDIKDLFGRYATAGTAIHTGTPVQADLQVVSKGKVTLGLAGASLGVNLGVSVGELTIRQANG